MAMQRRLYGVGSWLCMAWAATWCYKGSEVVGLVGRGPRGWSGRKSGRRLRMFGTAFVVCGRSSRVARATGPSNRAALWLVSGRGMSERRLRSWGCVFVAIVALCRVVDKASLLVRFFGSVILINRPLCEVFDPVSLINWINSLLL